MNLLIFSGAVVRPPRFSADGKTEVLGFTLVSSRKWRDKEFKTYCDVSLFGERAKDMRESFKVGDYLQVQGEAGARQYKTNDGEPKAALTCNALNVEVVAPAKETQQPVSPPTAAEPDAPKTDGDDSDVPF